MSVNLVVTREFEDILQELRRIRDSDVEIKRIPDTALLRFVFVFIIFHVISLTSLPLFVKQITFLVQ